MKMELKAKNIAKQAWFLAVWLLLLQILPGWARDNTKLLFVGEDLSIVTIASKRAESARSAPAVASVRSDERLKQMGIQTLGEAIGLEPGFFTTQREWGTQPFLRGVEDGILFLYDSVPLTSDATKSIHPMDEDLSLFFVKRLEIIRGPGSVLWGPDAFAGIVNVVPKRGRDINGIRSDVIYSTPFGKEQVDMAWGKNYGLWEAMVGLSASRIRPRIRDYIVKFQDQGDSGPVPPSERLGKEGVDDSSNLELLFNFQWKDWLDLSGRWSEMEKNYVLSEFERNLSWRGQRKRPFRFIKFEARHPVGPFTLALDGYVNELKFRQKEIDISWEQTSRVYYGELLLEREFAKTRGLFTAGLSLRRNLITGAVLGKSFMPDFLQPENELFTPTIPQKDFDTSLKSAFFQVRRHWPRFDIWAGLRMDDHSQYDLTWSHNLGLSIHPGPDWYLKLLYGTAFRTPYNQQLIGRKGLDPESVKNISLALYWRSKPTLKGELCLYWNRLHNHVKEDPFGLSNPGDGDIFGIELESSWKPDQWLKLWANTSLIHYTGDENAFKVKDFVFIKPDGTEIPHYSEWKSPFEKGPGAMARLGLIARPTNHWELSTVLTYNGPWWVTYEKGKIHKRIEPRFLMDVTLRARGLLHKNVDIYLAIKNLLNNRDLIPGTYSTFEPQGVSAFTGLEVRF